MTRTAPELYIEHTDKFGKTQKIVGCEGVFVVLYKGTPFNYFVENRYADVQRKYSRTLYNNEGHAQNLCEKLNKLFKTKDFSVQKTL